MKSKSKSRLLWDLWVTLSALGCLVIAFVAACEGRYAEGAFFLALVLLYHESERSKRRR